MLLRLIFPLFRSTSPFKQALNLVFIDLDEKKLRLFFLIVNDDTCHDDCRFLIRIEFSTPYPFEHVVCTPLHSTVGSSWRHWGVMVAMGCNYLCCLNFVSAFIRICPSMLKFNGLWNGWFVVTRSVPQAMHVEGDRFSTLWWTKVTFHRKVQAHMEAKV